MSGLSYVMTFVTITILLSADFWLVKNVSGRLLAGLRWWNVVDETSQNQMTWKFEAWTQEDRQLANKTQGILSLIKRKKANSDRLLDPQY